MQQFMGARTAKLTQNALQRIGSAIDRTGGFRMDYRQISATRGHRGTQMELPGFDAG